MVGQGKTKLQESDGWDNHRNSRVEEALGESNTTLHST